MFNPEKFYATDDSALLVLGRPSTLAHWRSEGRGPRFVKLGSKVVYRGQDLLDWIESRTVSPAQPDLDEIAPRLVTDRPGRGVVLVPGGERGMESTTEAGACRGCGHPAPWGESCLVCGRVQDPEKLKWLLLVRRTMLDHHAEKHVLRVLGDHAWAGPDDPELHRFDGQCALLRRTIVRETGLGDGTVKRALAGLVDKGIIERRPRWRPGGGQGASIYRILPANAYEEG